MRKVVIDEVHTYDAYMLRLLKIYFLSGFNWWFIILSATLPQKVRKTGRIIYKRIRCGAVFIRKREFPLITVVGKQTVFEKPSETRKS